ncbi:MAG TPA: protein-L-isoaspartate(D-aspartate) O-methyltransferase [Thermopetrobacter sp.]|nr:protein-L-isoaspartate(D-aspartate) O-methyltransferase [Thermopetrobacter sp.]
MTDETRKARLIMALRHHGIRDQRVLEAIEAVPRDLFVPESFRDHAWDDMALPISCGQTISQPYIVAFMTEQLELKPTHRVLEVGTGSGYQAAILSKLVRRVYTIERHRALLEAARERFERLGLKNIESRVGDGYRGWPEAAPFDRIIVTAAAPKPPRALLDQLAEDGIMIIPVDAGPLYQELVKIRRTADGYERERLIPVRFVPMLHGIARRGE